ncbi:MAG: winged helix-turn-helix transcriptional regulator, partial [Candidatus Hodarchaeota archaeon]
MSIEELYNISIRTLKIFKNEIESEKKINEAIYQLIAKKIIIRGTKLTKDSVLQNVKRKNIYRYISKNPGSHQREIRENLNLNPQLAAWHLKMLEKFDFIRKNRIKNKLIYFNSYVDPILDEKIFTLKDSKNFKILENILLDPGITLNELAKKIKISSEKVEK